MPYERRGSDIYKQESDGKWHLKNHCKSAENAKAQLRLLNAVKHGWVPAQGRR